MLNREGFYVTERERECTSCGKVFQRTSKTVALCNHCNSERVKCTSPERKMFSRAKARAVRQGTLFLIEHDDIVIPEICPVLGIPLKMHRGSPGGKHDSPALDRIDNEKGYVKGNVQVISHLANMMKSSADTEQLINFANWVLNNYLDKE